MFNPKVKNPQNPIAFNQSEPFNPDSPHHFSEDQIRIRAYQIYESGNRNSNHPEADWSQAETELVELVNAK